MSTDGLDVAEGWRVDGEWRVSPPLEAPDGASRAGVLLALSVPGDMPPMEARVFRADGSATPWKTVNATWGEVDHHVGVAELGEVGLVAELRIATSAVDTLEFVRWTAVVPDEEEDVMAPQADLGAASEALRSELRGLGIVTREAWGARSTRCSGRDSNKTRMAVHYTVTPSTNPERQVRSIQRYHMDSRGWCDVGYHFLVGVDGSIYEGRPLHLRGAHVGGHNSRNIGVSFIGCFHPSGCSRWAPNRPPDVMIDAGGRLLGELSRLYGITLDGSRVKGHRDHSGASTSCPGDYLRARIGDMLAIGRRGTTTPPPTTPPPPSGGASCAHSLGGMFGDSACSAGWQCCEGRWLERARGCGTCACVEETGRRGCIGEAPPVVEPPPTAPAGASCAHTYGGAYANTACSAGYQCCDGAWRTRSSGCGTCFCVEETGTSGCGMAAAPPPTPAPSGGTGGLPHAGLTQSGSEIPRAGISNSTLRSTLGISTEPYGTVVTDSGASWVQGRISWFGGPRDTGVTATETVAITGERARSLNDPVSPSASVLSSRPQDYYYAAMRWAYSPNGRTFWRDARILVRNPRNGNTIVVRPADWGPHTRTRRVIDLSPQSLTDLGMSTDDEAFIAFAAPGTPLGPVR